MEAKTWKGGTYGVRVGKPNAQKNFDKSWAIIKVNIDGKFYEFKLTSTFWTTCPEFRGGPIPAWFSRNKLGKWPKGKPHRLTLRPLGGNKFLLSSHR